MTIQSKQVFTTLDGKDHDSLEAAEAHQTMCDNAEVIDVFAESFVNTIKAPGAKVSDPSGLVGRTRAFNKNVAVQFAGYLLANGTELPADFEAIEPSEELQVRLDEEEAKQEEAKAKAEAKKADSKSKVEVSAEVSDEAAEEMFN